MTGSRPAPRFRTRDRAARARGAGFAIFADTVLGALAGLALGGIAAWQTAFVTAALGGLVGAVYVEIQRFSGKGVAAVLAVGTAVAGGTVAAASAVMGDSEAVVSVAGSGAVAGALAAACLVVAEALLAREDTRADQ